MILSNLIQEYFIEQRYLQALKDHLETAKTAKITVEEKKDYFANDLDALLTNKKSIVDYQYQVTAKEQEIQRIGVNIVSTLKDLGVQPGAVVHCIVGDGTKLNARSWYHNDDSIGFAVG